MKNIKLTTILAFCFFALIGLNSCDKAGKLDGTNWEGECEFKAHDEKWNGTISISFSKDDADIVAKFKVKSYWSDYTETYKGTATYNCEKDKITLKIKWKEDRIDDIDDGKWSGTFDKTTMTLKNVFGETVKFKK